MGLTLGTAGSYAAATGCGCLSGALLGTNALKRRHEDTSSERMLGRLKGGKITPQKSNIDTTNGHIQSRIHLFQGPSFWDFQPLVFGANNLKTTMVPFRLTS